MIQVALGGGCHWCTEAVFQSLKGVSNVEQGWAKSTPPSDSWSEAALLDVNTKIIPLEVVIEIHLRTHSSTSLHAMRSKYRSAIYFSRNEDEAIFHEILKRLQQDFDKELVTEVLSLEGFKKNEESFLDYYKTDPSRPFCQTYIEPKLKMLRDKYVDMMA